MLPGEADPAVHLDRPLAGGDGCLRAERLRRRRGDRARGRRPRRCTRRRRARASVRARAPSASSPADARPPGRCRSACRTGAAPSHGRRRARAPARRRRRPRGTAPSASGSGAGAGARSSRAAGPPRRPRRPRAAASRRSCSAPPARLRRAPRSSLRRRTRPALRCRGRRRAARGERPARLASRDLGLQVGRQAPAARRRRSTSTAHASVHARAPRTGPPPRGSRARRPRVSSATETPVQPSSASSCQDGSGVRREECPRLRRGAPPARA